MLTVGLAGSREREIEKKVTKSCDFKIEKEGKGKIIVCERRKKRQKGKGER